MLGNLTLIRQLGNPTVASHNIWDTVRYELFSRVKL